VIYESLLSEIDKFSGEIEVDESYFGGRRKGKRGRGGARKVAVFGLLKRGGKVFTLPVEDTKSNTLVPIIAWKVQPDSIVYTDSYRSYDVLDITDFHHMMDQSFEALRQQEEPHQWHRKLLESGKTSFAKIQRHPTQKLSSVFERMRVAVQLWTA